MKKKKNLIPILLLLLLLLLIVCVWCHSADIAKSRTSSSAQVATLPVVKKDIDSQNNTVAIKAQEEANDLKANEEAEEKARLEAEVKATEEKAATEKAKEEAAASKVKMEAEEKAKLEAEAKATEEKAAQEKAEEAEKARLEEEAKAKAFEIKIKKVIDAENINFKVNKDTLTTQSIRTIEHIAEILTKYPNVNVEIAGHTDSSGDSEKNLILSQKRVDSVKTKLIALDIDSHRLRAVGYGANHPLVSNDTKENRQKNRRVEFKVIGE